MKQYKFTDTNDTVMYNPPRILTFVDDNCLDTSIPNFETLTVEGRENLGRDVESINYKSITAGGKKHSSRSFENMQHQNKLLSSSITSRIIRINYKITSRNDYECRRNWEKIAYFTNREDVTLRFSDDKDYQYTSGTLIGVGEVPGSVNSAISYLEYECLDPFKYERVLQRWNFTNSSTFKYWSMYGVIVERIEITLKYGTSNVAVNNVTTGAYIKMSGSYKAGDTIIFDLLNNQVLKDTGEDITSQMDFASYLEDFTLDMNDMISTTGGAVKVFYRRRLL